MIELRLGAEAIPLPPGIDGMVLSPGVPASSPLVREAEQPRGAGDRRGRARVSRFSTARWWRSPARTGRARPRRSPRRCSKSRESTPCSAATSASRWRRRSTVRPAASFVVELSSFQLETVRTFRADAAALLNVTPDHLDRYPDFAAYAAAKARIFERQDERSVAVLNADDPETVAIGAGVGRSRRRWFSLRRPVEDGCYLDGGAVVEASAGRAAELFTTAEVAMVGQPQRRERDGGVAARARRRRRSRQPAPRRLTVRRPAAPHPPHSRAPRRGLVRRLQGHQRGRHLEVARRIPRPLGAPDPRRRRQGPGLRAAARDGRAQGEGGLPHRRRRRARSSWRSRAPRPAKRSATLERAVAEADAAAAQRRRRAAVAGLRQLRSVHRLHAPRAQVPGVGGGALRRTERRDG